MLHIVYYFIVANFQGSSETKCDGTPKNCDAVNLDLKGGDLTSHLGNSNEHCSCKCKENAACKAWTFVNYGNNKGRQSILCNTSCE